MKRRAYIEYDGVTRGNPEVRTKRTTILARYGSPITVGVNMGDHSDATVLELTAYVDGRWELASRRHGSRLPLEIVAEGRISDDEDL